MRIRRPNAKRVADGFDLFRKSPLARLQIAVRHRPLGRFSAGGRHMRRLAKWAVTVLVVLASACGKGGAPAPQSSAAEPPVVGAALGQASVPGPGSGSAAELGRM